MLVISNTEDINKGDYNAQIQAFGGNNYSPIKVENSSNQQVKVIVEDFAQPITVQAEKITSVAANGINYTPAVNPESPENGEYLWNPYSQQLQIFAYELPRSLQVSTPPPTIPVIPPLLREPHPTLFKNLPLEGSIQLTRSFEQHPSATAQFEIALPKSTIVQVLSPGLEIDIYGIPLRIENLDIKELPRAVYPDMRCNVTINFGGRWESYIEEGVFLRNDGSNGLSLEGTTDPNCENSYTPAKNSQTTTVSRLLRKAGIPYLGIQLKKIRIPEGTPRDAVASPTSFLNDRVRIARGFIRWSNPQGCEVLKVEAGKLWQYEDKDILSEISISYDAADKCSKKGKLTIQDYNPPEPDFVNFPSQITEVPVPQLRNESPTNLAFEYPNVELTGEFSQPEETINERTQGNSPPRYIRKPPKRDTRIDGDKNANLIPDNTVSIEVMSLCFDLGGPTKSRQFVTLENEAEVSIVTEVWGFVFTAIEIYDDSRKRILGVPQQQWKLIKQTRTEYLYEEQTGYLLTEIERGFRTVRYRKESVELPETLVLESDNPELALYQFFSLPITKRSSKYLELFLDWDSSNAVEFFKKCLRNGKSKIIPVLNPNYAPPYYERRARVESAGFARRENPSNEGLSADDETKRQPDLVVGEESIFENFTEVVRGVYRQYYEGGGVVRQGEEISPPKYYTYETKYKAQGEGISESLQESQVTEGINDPPQAKRRADLFVREEEQSEQKTEENANPNQYRYLIQTKGYSFSNPINGGESFSAAETLSEALAGAYTKLAIENWRNGFQESLQIPGNLAIKEGDKFFYRCNGELRKRVVISVSHNLEILGIVDRKKLVTAITNLTLGRYIFPELNYSKHLIPEVGEVESQPDAVTIVWRKNLGQILPLVGTTRRNP